MFSATIATETNTFSPLPTSLRSYQDEGWFRPGELPDDVPRSFSAPLFVARRRAARDGFTLVEGSCFATHPSGTTSRDAYETMRDEVLEQIRAALPLDGLLLGLHGAMVAYGYDDVEGDLIARARAIVGAGCVIGVELDPHCHLTVRRVQAADIIVLFKEFPHTDIVERAEELLTLLLRAIRREVQPVSALYDCRQLGAYPTTEPWMRGFIDRIKAMEGQDGLLSISICHSFPYADVPEIGVRVLVVADGDKAKAEAVATALGQELVAMRGQTAPPYLSVEDAVQAALTAERGPVVMADPADNPGGGAAGDNTTILRRLIEADAQNVAVGPIWDPIAARLCFDAGLGARLPLRIGGKIAPTSGQPIDAMVEVTALARDAWQMFGETRVNLGDCAAVRLGGIDIVLITERSQAMGLELFRNLGIEPAERQAILVKSTNHFRGAFGPIAARVLYVDADGPIPRDYRLLPYTKIQRPLWPLDDVAAPRLIL
ncbi:microcystin LR degradation protein MlrC-like protein [Pseudoroseomonas deserti]|uniref:Microcystinase C n=1 Tax=Teichococcus deserti TaxID=1817963 RepID=A0A1V2H720_9PROT|nr:microcystin LR degradation protein MlrC-like protein [Pseudoroseomonas deserti]